jgi:hypothetical protein
MTSASSTSMALRSADVSPMEPLPDEDFDLVAQCMQNSDGDAWNVLVDQHFFNDFPDAFADEPETREQREAQTQGKQVDQ